MKHRKIVKQMLCVLLCIALLPVVNSRAASCSDAHRNPAVLAKTGGAVKMEAAQDKPEIEETSGSLDDDSAVDELEQETAKGEKTQSPLMHIAFIALGAVAAVLIILSRRRKRMK